MKKISKYFLSFLIMCTVFLLSSLQTDANGALLNILCKCSSDLFVYEKPDIDSDILQEKNSGESIYVISQKRPWSTVFCEGKEGYVLTEYLVPADNEKLSEDKAFDGEALIEEYGSSLDAVYHMETEGKRGKKLFVIVSAVITVIVFAVADIVITKMRRKRMEKKAKRKEDDRDA